MKSERKNREIKKLKFLFLILGLFLSPLPLIFLFFSASSIITYSLIANYSPNGNGSTSAISELNGVPLKDILETWKMDSEKRTLRIKMYAYEQNFDLGHTLFEMCSLLGISTTLHRTPIIENRLTLDNAISPVFPMFGREFAESAPTAVSGINSVMFNHDKCCAYEHPAILQNRIDQHLMLDGIFFQSFKYFHHMKKKIWELLTPNVISFVRAEMIVPSEQRKDFILCIHTSSPNSANVIRTPSDSLFTRLATDSLVQKYKKKNRNTTVLLLGNDPLWEGDLFSDAIAKSKVFHKKASKTYSANFTALLTPSVIPEDDISIVRTYCNVLLLTAPTSPTGWWLAYLANPSTEIYYRNPAKTKDPVRSEMIEEDYFPPEWLKLTELSNFE